MFSNLLRQVTLVIILILAVNKVELHWVASAGFVGELIAMVAVSHSVSGAMGCRISYWMNPIIGLIIFSIAGYLLVEGMVALGLQIVLLLLVLIMTGYSAIHAVRMLNTLNKG